MELLARDYLDASGAAVEAYRCSGIYLYYSSERGESGRVRLPAPAAGSESPKSNRAYCLRRRVCARYDSASA